MRLFRCDRCKVEFRLFRDDNEDDENKCLLHPVRIYVAQNCYMFSGELRFEDKIKREEAEKFDAYELCVKCVDDLKDWLNP